MSSLFRVMIVDDEPLVRLALSAVVPWNELECVVVAEASDGQEAWNRIANQQDVDLMIVDMHMPYMNGLSLLAKLQEEMLPNTPLCVVLSAFSDFDYVRKSFLYGAVDYIMKTDLDREHILPVINRAVQQLKERLSQQGLAQNHHDDRVLIEREVWLRGLLRESSSMEASAASLDADSQIWLSSLSSYQQVIVSVLPDRMSQAAAGEAAEPQDQELDHVARVLKQGMKMGKVPFECIQVRPHEYAILLCIDISPSYLNRRGSVMEMLDALRNTVKNFLNMTLSIGISDVCTDWRQWPTKYQQARTLAHLRFSEGPGRVYYPEHALGTEKISPTPWNFPRMMQLMKTGDSQWRWYLDEGLRQLDDMSHVTLDSCSSLYDELLWNLGVLLHAEGMNWTHVLDSQQKPYEAMEQLVFREDLHDWLTKIAIRTAGLLHPGNVRVDIPQRLVERVKQYVEQNYNKVITLGQVSEWAKVTESHLSKQFVKETGEHFIEYVTKLRLSEAKRLMQSDMKMYEIADQVGYENPEHFSRVFKRYMGVSPQKYRDMLANKTY